MIFRQKGDLPIDIREFILGFSRLFIMQLDNCPSDPLQRKPKGVSVRETPEIATVK